MAAGDSITAIDSVSAGTTTVQPSAGDVWRVTGWTGNTNTDLQAYDGTNATNNLTDTQLEQGEAGWFADNSEYLQWNNTGCSAENAAYSGQKVIE